jgi:Mn-containing catalase
MRVYEMTDNPVARVMIGYLLVRGGVHITAYAKALEVATGVDMTKMLPIPNLDYKVFDKTRKYEEMGVHRKLYSWNFQGEYKDISKI